MRIYIIWYAYVFIIQCFSSTQIIILIRILLFKVTKQQLQFKIIYSIINSTLQLCAQLPRVGISTCCARLRESRLLFEANIIYIYIAKHTCWWVILGNIIFLKCVWMIKKKYFIPVILRLQRQAMKLTTLYIIIINNLLYCFFIPQLRWILFRRSLFLHPAWAVRFTI